VKLHRGPVALCGEKVSGRKLQFFRPTAANFRQDIMVSQNNFNFAPEFPKMGDF